MKIWIRAVALAAGLAGCATVQAGEEPVVMRWDHRPEAAEWTMATRGALADHGAALVDLVPEDIDTWCPAYETADRGARELFWTGLFSALAKHEHMEPACVRRGRTLDRVVADRPADSAALRLCGA